MSKREDIFESIIKVAPGTVFREGLENILNAKTGAIIVVGDSEEVLTIVKGGFKIDCDYSPAKLYELAKMDGAIVLTEDTKKILFANAQLEPDSSISSNETGIRHRTAEKVAKQTGKLVISISQRRGIITLYKSNKKYVLRDSSKVIIKANQAVQTLENYKKALDMAMNILTSLEFEDNVILYDVCKVLQRTEMMMRIVEEIEKYIMELGTEGILVKMQLDELTENVLEDCDNVIKDYAISDKDIQAKVIRRQIRKLSSDELWDLNNIAKTLGYEGSTNMLDHNVSTNGYRILNKIPRIPVSVFDNLISAFGNFQDVLQASTEKLEEVEGIGAKRAKVIKEKLNRLYEMIMQDRII